MPTAIKCILEISFGACGRVTTWVVCDHDVKVHVIMNTTEVSLEEYSGFIGFMYQVYTVLAPFIFVVVIIMLLFYVVLFTLK